MAKAQQSEHFVVDGSNIATEGRSQPSLEQLNEAVLAFIDEHPEAMISVVVDATFGHRIGKKEVKAFDEAVANNELVTPPAGAIGRGDAFVLSIANKAGAGVLSNDSFQEFHGDYDWLFDEGRLIGGKPVPHVGWVFVARTPVRGPKSRRSVREAKTDDSADRSASKQQANRRVRAKKTASGDAEAPQKQEAAPEAAPAAKQERSSGGSRRSRRGGSKSDAPANDSAPVDAPKDHVNELMPFLDFVEHHPVGTSCTAVVESYASHGAYARTGDALIYLPLRLLGDPTPRSARSVLSIGDSITVVIVGFTPDRRSIDAALPHMAGDRAAPTGDAEQSVDAGALEKKSTRSSKRSAKKTAAKKTSERKAATKKAPAKKTVAKKTATKRAAAKKTPAKATAKRAATKKTPAKKAATKQAAARPAKTAAAKTAAKKTAATKTAATKTAATKTAATKTAAKRAAKKTAAKKTAAKKATSRART